MGLSYLSRWLASGGQLYDKATIQPRGSHSGCPRLSPVMAPCPRCLPPWRPQDAATRRTLLPGTSSLPLPPQPPSGDPGADPGAGPACPCPPGRELSRTPTCGDSSNAFSPLAYAPPTPRSSLAQDCCSRASCASPELWNCCSCLTFASASSKCMLPSRTDSA